MHKSMQIRRHIFLLAEGELFTSRDLSIYGKRGTIDQNLNRLVKLGVIVRVTRGIFMRETASGWRPSLKEVAIAKARSFGKEIYDCGLDWPKPGIQAEFSNESNGSVTFLSSGCSSSFVYNNQRIYFKGVCPSKLREQPVLSLTSSESVLNFEPNSFNGDFNFTARSNLTAVEGITETRTALSQLPQWLNSKLSWLKPKAKTPAGESAMSMSAAQHATAIENQ